MPGASAKYDPKKAGVSLHHAELIYCGNFRPRRGSTAVTAAEKYEAGRLQSEKNE